MKGNDLAKKTNPEHENAHVRTVLWSMWQFIYDYGSYLYNTSTVI